MNDPSYDDLRTRLAALKAKHDKTTSGDYAKQQRTFARRLCVDAGLNQTEGSEIAPWAALRPTGWEARWHAENDRSWAIHMEKKQREEAQKKAVEAFHQEENNFCNAVEMDLQRWYEEHGKVFFDYLNDFPQFRNIALWDGLRRLAFAWSQATPLTKYHDEHPPPCPLPPACGRADFMSSLPPGTPDLGKEANRQVLQDDLDLTPTPGQSIGRQLAMVAATVGFATTALLGKYISLEAAVTMFSNYV